ETTTTTTTTSPQPIYTIVMPPSYIVQEIISYPTKTEYTVGESLDLTGVSVKVRSQAYWQEVEGGSRAGIIYGEPFVLENITLDPANAIIGGENGAIWKGDMADELTPGSYTVMYDKTYTDDQNREIQFGNFKHRITVKEADGIQPYSYVFTVKDKDTGELLKNGALSFSTYICYEINGEDVFTGPISRYDLSEANPVVYNYAKYKDAKEFSIESIYAQAEGYTFVDAREDIRDGGDPTIRYYDVLMTKGDAGLKGDTNCDGKVELADAILIMQSLANPDKYGENGTAEKPLTKLGRKNGDVNSNGLSADDALSIQKFLLHIIPSLDEA
ncbi:MAG TPA: dockerin type I repeat-containing protein, partial [Ruminococcus sp.]